VNIVTLSKRTSFFNMMLYIIILLLVLIRENRSARTVFFGHTESDQIIYTSVIIPRYTTSLELIIFISDPKSTPYALFKYNGKFI
jgi:hypothetical protein